MMLYQNSIFVFLLISLILELVKTRYFQIKRAVQMNLSLIKWSDFLAHCLVQAKYCNLDWSKAGSPHDPAACLTYLNRKTEFCFNFGTATRRSGQTTPDAGRRPSRSQQSSAHGGTLSQKILLRKSVILVHCSVPQEC